MEFTVTCIPKIIPAKGITTKQILIGAGIVICVLAIGYFAVNSSNNTEPQRKTNSF